MTLTDMLLRRVRSRLRPEAGFTMIELMVAIGIILVALLALAYTATIGFTDIALARQRQSATGLANQAMEQVRALPFDALKNGLSNLDSTMASDANIIKTGVCGSTYCFGSPPERVPTGDIAVSPPIVPLVPHTQTIVVGPTTYTVRAYVTNYQNSTTNDTYRLTVIVTWPNPARRGVSSSVTTQSLAYSSTGCLSTGTHPFAAPCQPFLYGNGVAAAGHFDITGTINTVNLSSANLTLPGWSSNLQVEQISAVQGLAHSSSGSVTITGNPATVSGGQQAASGADNDPAQPGNDWQYTTVSGSGGCLVAGGGDCGGGSGQNSLIVTPSTGDPGATVSTTDASVAHLCPLVGISQNDLQPCGSSTEQQLDRASINLSLKKQFDLGTIRLASVLAAPSISSSFTQRDVQSNADGLVHSETSRSIGRVRIGGLPDGLDSSKKPAGWSSDNYLIQITDFTDKVTAESGTNTAVPSVTTGGTISYWNGSGYTNVALAPGASQGLPVASVHITDTVSGQPLNIDITGSTSLLVDCLVWTTGCPTTGGTSTSETFRTCNPACPNTRTAATAQSNSPLVGNIQYSVTFGGTTLANLTIHVDLGTIKAQNSYQPAPSGA